MPASLKLNLLGRKDSDGNEYFFTRPNIPVLVDLSQCVIFVHPIDEEDGSSSAELVVKRYHKPLDKKRERKSA